MFQFFGSWGAFSKQKSDLSLLKSLLVGNWLVNRNDYLCLLLKFALNCHKIEKAILAIWIFLGSLDHFS